MSKTAKSQMTDLLRAVPLLSTCSKRELSLLAGIAEEKKYEAGHSICQEGDQDVGLHIIVEGRARVSVGGEDRRTLAVSEFFGEIALLDRQPRSAAVTADTDVTTLAIPAWGFNAILKAEPEIAIKMLKEMARRIRQNDMLR